ncbi:hypothetical protein [Microbacterium sp.]|uniref:hypothetical protein n=1 Tax=Microbacterium sp. TaxID=51671 RepID=UPI001ACEBD21|nr:hypothetical protein [Microbacterium sp.]MBN9155812.1 hypothetical protein [Microbacterium sp.]
MPQKIKLHHIDGSTAEIDAIDARRVLRDHPSEWAETAFPADVQKKAQDAAKQKRVEILKIKTSGRPQHEIEAALADMEELHQLQKEEADKAARAGKPKAEAKG